MITYEIKLDPNEVFIGKHCTKDRLIEALGIIPEIIFAAMQKHNRENESIFDSAVKLYGFGGFPLQGCKVNEKLQMIYPGDPVEDPYALYIYNDRTVAIQYNRAIIAIINDDCNDYIFTRMD